MRPSSIALIVLLAACETPVTTVSDDGGETGDADTPDDLARRADSGARDAASGDGGCHPGKSCAECGEHRQCTPSACGDAVCGDCESGFVDDGTCIAAQSPQQCAAANREYIAAGMLGYCGACLLGTDEVMGRCFAMAGTSCSQESDCSDGNRCLQLSFNDAPKCRQAPCDLGQSWDRSFDARGCIDCSGTCGDGAWPVTDRSGNCYCSASPDHFYNSDVFRFDECDRDNDGWINEEVLEELKLASGEGPAAALDYTVLLNVRCTIPVFDKVELRNEWNQPAPPLSFTADLGLASNLPVPMYEHPENDRGVPGYPGMAASSVNSLTKACWSDKLDLNQNGLSDLEEFPQQVTARWAEPYKRLTNFVELYQTRYQKSGAGLVQPCLDCPGVKLPGSKGTLVITERSRCSDFPFAPSGSDYWQSCTRRRDPGFTSTNQLGYDFAAFECAGDGACAYSWPPPVPNPPPTVLPPPVVSPAPAPGIVAHHGLCDPDVQPTGPWRGMTHYSQFRCAASVTSPATKRSEVQIGDPSWEPQACTLTGQPLASPSLGTLPQFSCTPAAPTSVGWFARKFSGYTSATDYSGGCIDEGVEWGLLCPHDRSSATGKKDAFGQLICGPACAPSDTFYAGGYWACVQPTTTAFTEPGRVAFTDPSDVWKLTGESPVGSGDNAPLTSPGCDGGAGGCYRLE